MLDFKSQSELAEASATLMRTCAMATAQTFSASALRGLSLWTQMLRSAAAGAGTQQAAWRWQQSAAGRLNPWMAWVGRPVTFMPMPMTEWAAMLPTWSRASDVPSQPSAEAEAPQAANPYAAYRSFGGHAVAQVIMGEEPPPRPA